MRDSWRPASELQCPTQEFLEVGRRLPAPGPGSGDQRDEFGETVYDLEFGARKVRFPGSDQTLTLVVDGLGQKPLMLLTNRKVTRSRKSIWWVEETIRSIKQGYRLEDIRVLTRVPFLRDCGWDQPALARQCHRYWTASSRSSHESASPIPHFSPGRYAYDEK